jgi:hypothetical protein
MNASDISLFDLIRLADYLEEKIMAKATAKIAEVVSSFDAAQQRVEKAVADLRAEVETLKGEATTPEDLAALDALDAKIDALDPSKPAVLPPTGEPPVAPEV